MSLSLKGQFVLLTEDQHLYILKANSYKVQQVVVYSFADKLNKASIEEIQRSIFLVALDGPIVNPTGNEMTDAALLCVHGNGSQGYAGNRWYDKTIQVIFFSYFLLKVEV